MVPDEAEKQRNKSPAFPPGFRILCSAWKGWWT